MEIGDDLFISDLKIPKVFFSELLFLYKVTVHRLQKLVGGYNFSLSIQCNRLNR